MSHIRLGLSFSDFAMSLSDEVTYVNVRIKIESKIKFILSKLTIYQVLFCVLGTLHPLFHSILRKFLWMRCYHSPFADVENGSSRDFLGSTLVKMQRFHCRGCGFDPWSGN